MEMTAKTIAGNIEDFSSQHLAVTMWAIAKLDYVPSKEILQATAERAVKLVPAFNPQNIANTLWSYATLAEYPGAALLDTAAASALVLMPVRFFLSPSQQSKSSSGAKCQKELPSAQQWRKGYTVTLPTFVLLTIMVLVDTTHAAACLWLSQVGGCRTSTSKLCRTHSGHMPFCATTPARSSWMQLPSRSS